MSRKINKLRIAFSEDISLNWISDLFLYPCYAIATIYNTDSQEKDRRSSSMLCRSGGGEGGGKKTKEKTKRTDVRRAFLCGGRVLF